MDLPLPTNRLQLLDLPALDSLKILEQDVCAGLLSAPRSLPPKYFYDAKGSKLFTEICNTQDYYITRTEVDLLQQYIEKIISATSPQSCVELGAGESVKTELLLSNINMSNNEFVYTPIDVCKEVLVESAQRLLSTFPDLKISPIVAEYTLAIHTLKQLNGPTLFLFLGSSIGNFNNSQAIGLLTEVAQRMQPDDYFLLGLDRVKDKDILEKAYDDREGITAQFNLNVLKVLNDKLNSNFNLKDFSHQAIYNDKDEQIEMYLISNQNQEVFFPTLNETIHLQKNEKILTEISRKYTNLSIQQLLSESGLIEYMRFQPSNEYFSLILAKIFND